MARTIRFLLLASLSALGAWPLACAKPEETSPPAAVDGGDTGGADTIAETNPETGVCTPAAIESRACGRCGKQKRLCSAEGTWRDWGTCDDELATAECGIGETRDATCDKCATGKDTCDTATCTWKAGTCTGGGPCVPGDVDKTSASCTTPGEIRTRTCDDKCQWSAFTPCSLPTDWVPLAAAPTALIGRYGHVVEWTGSDMIVWGGINVDPSTFESTVLKDGASFNLAGSVWTMLATAPSVFVDGRAYTAHAYTGSQLLIWGGVAGSTFDLKADGARYDAKTKSWSSMSSTGAPSARYYPGSVWSTTTSEMIVWGGCTATDSSTGACTSFADDGAAYDPATDKWTALPAAPTGFAARGGHSMIWTGSEVILWGGYDGKVSLKDGARYDPKTKVWTSMPAVPSGFEERAGHASAWSGTELFVFGGAASASSLLSSAGHYTPGGSWTAATALTDTIVANSKRQLALGWFGKGKFYVWSGANSSDVVSGGAFYDPKTDKWTKMPDKDAPDARAYATVAWTGAEAIVWGGLSISKGAVKSFNDGGIYRP